jgi:hypothetical protein
MVVRKFDIRRDPPYIHQSATNIGGYIPRCQIPSSVSVPKNIVQLYSSLPNNIKKLRKISYSAKSLCFLVSSCIAFSEEKKTKERYIIYTHIYGSNKIVLAIIDDFNKYISLVPSSLFSSR